MKLIVKVILKFLLAIMNVVLLPINALLEASFPNIGVATTYVTNLLNWLEDFTAWVISWLPFSSAFYTFVVSAILFIHIVPVLASAIKIVVKWWHALAP